ncbi:MAG: type II toxin-antitoxin system VapC family toxin [Candidatus Methanoperedens sp.]|nr:type II toxin-antitoxin system VapC family toxin [Candidatus Methanoperedens sp.]MCZ7370786.1 type II toxin-antitoxin system VapC family toxin [Candidatus Methanoperedens sp.]
MIYDASSIYRAIEIGDFNKLLEGKTLDLAQYELGNVVWKEVTRKKISESEGAKLIKFISKVISLMEILKIGIKNEVLKVAVDNNLSYYDASYLYASISMKDVLVTEDKKLLDRAIECSADAGRFEDLLDKK